MIREAVIAAALAGAAVGSAPVVMAEPNDNIYFDKPGRYDSDVPFMNYEAHLAAPCDNFEINTFGRGPGGFFAIRRGVRPRKDGYATRRRGSAIFPS